MTSKSKRLNVLGFLNKDNRLESYCFNCNIDSEIVIKCFDEFSKTVTKKTVVIMDNASVHRSKKFEAKIRKWNKKGLYIIYLSKYSPELNLIEILWRFIKYHWLPFSSYLSFKHLVENVEFILKNVGIIYKINFA